MPYDAAFESVRAEIADAQARASQHTQSLAEQLRNPCSVSDVQEALFHELDSIILLRTRLIAIRGFKHDQDSGER